MKPLPAKLSYFFKIFVKICIKNHYMLSDFHKFRFLIFEDTMDLSKAPCFLLRIDQILDVSAIQLHNYHWTAKRELVIIRIISMKTSVLSLTRIMDSSDIWICMKYWIIQKVNQLLYQSSIAPFTYQIIWWYSWVFELCYWLISTTTGKLTNYMSHWCTQVIGME